MLEVLRRDMIRTDEVVRATASERQRFSEPGFRTQQSCSSLLTHSRATQRSLTYHFLYHFLSHFPGRRSQPTESKPEEVKALR